MGLVDGMEGSSKVKDGSGLEQGQNGYPTTREPEVTLTQGVQTSQGAKECTDVEMLHAAILREEDEPQIDCHISCMSLE